MARVAKQTVVRGTEKPASKPTLKAVPTPLSHKEALLATTGEQPVAITETVRQVINLSDEQLAIATEVQTGEGNIVVRARAGTGKTYLLRRCVPLMHGEIAIAAYNRKIAKEIRAKLADDGLLMRTWAEVNAKRDGLDVGTFHSFGWRVLTQCLKGIRLEGRDKGNAGFRKFDVICERLKISKPLQGLIRKAMERAQERLLELPAGHKVDPAVAAAQLSLANAKRFFDEVIAATAPQYRQMMMEIAAKYPRFGFLTEAQMRAVQINASKARLRMPELAVGEANKIVIPESKTDRTGPQPIGANDKLDPAWFDLAQHYALELDLPSDEHIEMQLLRNAMPVGSSADAVREEMLRRCLVLAAKAIHESARMATETFRAKRFIKGREIEGEEFTGVASFGEMLYLPLYFNLSIPQYDFVCVDEAQDSNPARREFARRMLKPSGRFIWVGDDRQAIYGWAGADNDALDQIISQFNCKVFPMTTTFRCAKAIVRLVQPIVPDYRAADSNPEGATAHIDEANFIKATEFCPTDAIICRNTAPLVKTAYRLIARGVACHVEGKDIGKRLLPLLYRWPAIKNIGPFTDKLIEYRDAENAKFMAQDMEAAAEELNDRVETIMAIVEFLPKSSKVSDIQEHVEKLFADSEDGETPDNVTLISAHRAKGLEFPRVFGLGVAKYMPSPYAKQEWARKQEENLEYVLKTRAINEYIDVAVI